MYVCMYACLYVCMYIRMYVCMYVHILHMESLAQERVSDTDDLMSINMCWVIRCFTLPAHEFTQSSILPVQNPATA
jgi:hypothetical protein